MSRHYHLVHTYIITDFPHEEANGMIVASFFTRFGAERARRRYRKVLLSLDGSGTMPDNDQIIMLSRGQGTARIRFRLDVVHDSEFTITVLPTRRPR